MSLALNSQRALHAVRLVIRDYQFPSGLHRQFSVAVLPNYPSPTRTVPSFATVKGGDTWNLRHAASDCPTSDFLESPTSPEYTSAALTLPSRPVQSTAHWATLYPSPSSTAPPTQARRCDTLAHLASSGNLSVARTVYNELKALHVGIQRRSSYLTSALISLTPTESGKADFLFWLELVPNRPAVQSHAGVKAIWAPVVDKLIGEFPTDKIFLSDFLLLAARKGILPTVFPRLMRHLAMISPLSELEMLMERLQEAYEEGTTSRRSVSARAEAHAAYAQLRVQEMRNVYVRVIAGAGWVEEAESMLEGGDGWAPATLEYVEAKRAALSYTSEKATIPAKLIALVRQARASRIGPTNLANVIEELGALHRTSLNQRLELRFATASDPSRREVWYHAQILLARRNKLSNQAIIELFDRTFTWVGIPSHNISLPSNPTPTTKLNASSALFTTILPSLLPLIPAPLEFHASYLTLTSSLSPRLQPTPITHSGFLREITHLLGPSAGLEALRNMVDAGLEPGLKAYESVLWSMAGRGEYGGMVGLLSGMEEGVEIREGTRLPQPVAGTYRALVGILERAGNNVEAEKIRERAERRGLEIRNTSKVEPKLFQSVMEEKKEEGVMKGQGIQGMDKVASYA